MPLQPKAALLGTEWGRPWGSRVSELRARRVCTLESQFLVITALTTMTRTFINSNGGGCHHTHYYHLLFLNNGSIVSNTYDMPGTKPSSL